MTSERKDYESKMETQFKEIGAKIDAFVAKMKSAKKGGAAVLDRDVERLREKRIELRGQFDEMKRSADQSWQDLKAKFDGAWREFKASVDSAASRFK